VVELTASGAVVELGEGIRAALLAKKAGAAGAPAAETAKTASALGASPQSGSAPSAAPDLSQLSSMLKARWKGNAPTPTAPPEPLAESQIRSFKITKLVADTKKIEVELA
jgi:small subunit ribosomal protein S1